ncbi:MAG: hypothetical protein Q7K57_29155 [Burkholderiaceae bacterium]|nr:hypothetical protein [Burkholderiaceae bacterium]
MAAQTWISVFGSVKISEGVIRLLPLSGPLADGMPPADGSAVQPPHAIVRSNLEFEQGTITWESKLGEQSTRAQLLLAAEAKGASGADSSKAKGDSSAAFELSAGLNVLGAPYGFAMWTGGAWEGVGGTGHGTVLPVGKWIHMKLTVRGSDVDLYVEGVKVVSTTATLKRAQIGFLLQGSVESEIRNVVVTESMPTCFAVMQFTEEFNILYQDVIRPVCESYGYKVVRGDDFYTSGLIMEDVTQSIRSAALIIADVTPDNANVFYEVGYAHAINKPTILLSDRKRERLPFDISGFRTLFYDNTIGGKSQVEERLKQHLEALR